LHYCCWRLKHHRHAGFNAAELMLGPDWVSSTMLWRGDIPASNNAEMIILFQAFSVVCIYVGFRYFQIEFLKSRQLLLVLFVICILSVFLFIVLFGHIKNPLAELTRPELFLIVWPPLILGLLVASWSVLFSRPKHVSANASVLEAWYLLLVPYIAVFGTTNSYFNSIILFPFFGLCALLIVISRASSSSPSLHLACLASFVILVSGLLTHKGILEPYRQSSWLEDGYGHVEIGHALEGIRLSQRDSSYIENLVYVAERGGLKKGTPLIDLSGASPGSAYILGAKPIGAYWLLGGYPGSETVASRHLSAEHFDELSLAWVLTEESRQRSLSLRLLEQLGRPLNQNYEFVASIEIPAGYGGRKKVSVQKLYRPIK